MKKKKKNNGIQEGYKEMGEEMRREKVKNKTEVTSEKNNGDIYIAIE